MNASLLKSSQEQGATRRQCGKVSVALLLLISILAVCSACGFVARRWQSENVAHSAPARKIKVVNIYPHDPAAFTQGLIFHNGQLLESTGLHGASSLRRVDLRTGNVVEKVAIPDIYFAEGLTLLGNNLYQLTWQSHKGFIYSLDGLQQVREFSYDGEGWGLTTDDRDLIMSDGTDRIRFINPNSFQVEKTINVRDGERSVSQLNELEFVNGEIYANIWHSDFIARIDPETGRVKSWIDCTGLLAQAPDSGTSKHDVLNGIAYDKEKDRLFLTGKLWHKLFEVKIVEH